MEKCLQTLNKVETSFPPMYDLNLPILLLRYICHIFDILHVCNKVDMQLKSIEYKVKSRVE